MITRKNIAFASLVIMIITLASIWLIPMIFKSKEASAGDTEIEGSGNIVQKMQNSPGSMQLAGDIHVDTRRRLEGELAKKLITDLQKIPA